MRRLGAAAGVPASRRRRRGRRRARPRASCSEGIWIVLPSDDLRVLGQPVGGRERAGREVARRGDRPQRLAGLHRVGHVGRRTGAGRASSAASIAGTCRVCRGDFTVDLRSGSLTSRRRCVPLRIAAAGRVPTPIGRMYEAVPPIGRSLPVAIGAGPASPGVRRTPSASGVLLPAQLGLGLGGDRVGVPGEEVELAAREERRAADHARERLAARGHRAGERQREASAAPSRARLRARPRWRSSRRDMCVSHRM